jgi:hypothetical protein
MLSSGYFNKTYEEANAENSMENLGILDHEVVGAKYLSDLGFYKDLIRRHLSFQC